MPLGPTGPTGPIDDESERTRRRQADDFRDWLNANHPEIPTCFFGHDTWAIGAMVNLFPAEGGGPFGSIAYPVFQLICTTCGQTLLFNAAATGVIVQGAVAQERDTAKPGQAS